jgi:hypothetical protein
MLDVADDARTVLDPQDLADRYAALWNEPDSAARSEIIRALWAPTGEHVLDPPEELRHAASVIGFEAPKLEIQGYAAIEARVARAHEDFVASGQHFFRARDNAVQLRNLVKFNWEMVARATGAVDGFGLEVLVLDDRHRITIDYQFVER